MNGREQVLEGAGLVDGMVEFDPGVQCQESAERIVAGLQAREQNRDDRKRRRSPLRPRLPVEAELDLAVLPAADAFGPEQNKHAPTAGESGLQRRLPGPPGSECPPVDEDTELGLGDEPVADGVGCGLVGTAVAQENVVAGAGWHGLAVPAAWDVADEHLHPLSYAPLKYVVE